MSALIVALIVATLGLVACGGNDDAGAPAADAAAAQAPAADADTPAPPADEPAAPDAAAGEATVAAAEHAHGDGGLIALTMAATDAVDTAGFHGMQEELETSGVINERWASGVQDALTAVRAVPWDDALAHGAEGLAAALDDFRAALERGDADAALAAAEAVHEEQHHFSPAVYAWLGEQRPGHDDASILVTSLAAIDIIDSAGFHDMGDAITEAAEISGRDARTVANALVVVNAAHWPENASPAADALAAALEDTAREMEGGNIETTLEGLQAIHDAQHGLSQGFYGWLAENHATIDHSDPLVAQACLLKSIDMVNSAGLHAMAEDLETTASINDRWAGQVDKLVAVFAGAPHHGGASDASMHMHEQLTALRDALVAQDIAFATDAALAAHEAQHDLSHTGFATLAESATLQLGGVHEDDGHAHAAALDMDDARTVEVVATEFAFGPNDIRAEVGETVRLVFRNDGAVLHDITTDAFAGEVTAMGSAEHSDSTAHAHDDAMAFHVAADAGEEAELYFMASAPGEYALICSVPGHEQLGMTAHLVIE